MMTSTCRPRQANAGGRNRQTEKLCWEHRGVQRRAHVSHARARTSTTAGTPVRCASPLRAPSSRFASPLRASQQPEHAEPGGAPGVPPAPYRFERANVLYQPALVRASAARAVTPGPEQGLRLLELFGWTLGGVFVVEWTQSPIGPYREVAVLSGLVARGPAIGAWASHIVVTTPAAVASGRDVFGLPAALGRVDLPEGSPEPPASARIEFLRDDSVCVRGWREGPPEDAAPPPSDAAQGDGKGLPFRISLPSFSGCLETKEAPASASSPAAAADTPEVAADPPRHSVGGRTPLLRYPLQLGPWEGLKVRTALPTQGRESCSEGLRAVLGGPLSIALLPLPCLQLDGVDVVAGTPEAVGGKTAS